MKIAKRILISFLFLFVTTIQAQQNTAVIQERINKVKEKLGDKLLTTADEVIAKYIEAVGGKEATLSVKTLMYRGRFLSYGINDRTLCRYFKRPNFIKASWSKENNRYTVSDGDKVWSMTPDGRKEQDAPWAISFSHQRIDGNFIDYKNRGIKYDYLGLEGFESEHAVYYLLRRTFPDGFIEKLYFDVETGFLNSIWKMSEPWVNRPTYYYDYRKVGNIRLPHVWISVLENANPPHVLLIEEVRINKDFGENFFNDHLEKPILK